MKQQALAESQTALRNYVNRLKEFRFAEGAPIEDINLNCYTYKRGCRRKNL